MCYICLFSYVVVGILVYIEVHWDILLGSRVQRLLGEGELDFVAAVGSSEVLGEFGVGEVPCLLSSIVHTPPHVRLLITSPKDLWLEMSRNNSIPVNLSLR